MNMKTVAARVCAAALLAGLFGAGSAHAQSFTFTHFDYPGGSGTVGTGINTSGQIAGYYFNGGWHSYLRSADGSSFVGFDDPNGTTFPQAINDPGQIVGSYPFATAGTGFLRSADGVTFMDVNEPAAAGGNPSGGFGTVAAGINNAGQISGFYAVDNSTSGFLRSSDGSTYVSFNVPGAAATIARKINNSGEIVGHYYDAASVSHGFLRSGDGSTFTLFDNPNAATSAPGAVGTFAWGVNDQGQIVGYYYDASGGAHGFLRNSDGSFVAIDDPSATSATLPLGINNSGVITGTTDNAHGFTAVMQPLYDVCALYDQTKAVHSGAVIPIKIYLCDSSGIDLSSSSIVVHATGVSVVSASAPGELEYPGNSNPDFDFRYDSTLGPAGGYIFNLKTDGMHGTYNLNFTAGADPSTHSVQFEVK